MRDLPAHSCSTHQTFLQKTVSYAPLGIILLLALILRCIELDLTLWLDEVRTYERAAHGLFDALRLSATPISDVLAAWGLYLGDTETAMRVPFVMVGMAGVAMAYVIGQMAGGKPTGLVAALFIATSAYHVFWSQTARYYILVMLLVMVAVWALYYAVKTNRPLYWFLFALIGVVGTLNHLTFLPPFGAASLGAFVLILCGRGQARKARAHQAITLIFCLALAPAIYVANAPSALGALSGVGSKSSVSQASEASVKIESASVYDTEELAKRFSANPQDSDVVDVSKLSYRLSPRQYYVEFFQKFFPGFTDTIVGCLLLAFLSIVGAVRLCRNQPLLGAPLLCAFLLTPVPFFFLTTRHSYDTYYFAAVVPIVFLFLSIGVVAAGDFVFQLITRKRTFGSRITCVLKPATTCAVVVLMLPMVVNGLQSHYQTRPERDWKTLANIMSQHLQRNDLIVYGSGWDWANIKFDYYVRFYLSRFLPASQSYAPAHFRTTSVQALIDKIRDNPGKNVWTVVNWGWLSGDDAYRLSSFLPGQYELGRRPELRFTLDVFGEPTANLFPMAGFERTKPSELSAYAELVSDDQAYAGMRALKITNESAPSGARVAVALPVKPTIYPMDNSQFRLLKDGIPHGWQCDNLRNMDFDRRANHFCVLASPEPTTLRQRLQVQPQPGTTLRAIVDVKADSPSQVDVAIEYSRKGQKEYLKGSSSGGGEWEGIVCQGTIPKDVDPDSVSCVIRCLNANETVNLKNVTVSAEGRVLDAGLAYTLSMQLKNRNTFEDLLWISLQGETADGTPFQTPLLEVASMTTDWRLISRPVIPGVHVPNDARTLNVVFELSPKVKGTIWVDDVQFEAKDHPTPFVEGVRIPHDESLAGFMRE